MQWFVYEMFCGINLQHEIHLTLIMIKVALLRRYIDYTQLLDLTVLICQHNFEIESCISGMYSMAINFCRLASAACKV